MKKNVSFAVLVTDKNRHIRDLLLRELSTETLEVFCGVSCGEIYELMRSSVPPAVVVLDPEVFDDDQQLLLPQLFCSLPDTLFILHTFIDLPLSSALYRNVRLVAKNGGSVEVIRRMLLAVLKED